MFVPDLKPLVDAHLATDNEEESQWIANMLDALQNDSPWPRRMYDCGAAATILKPDALKALGEVVEEYYAVTRRPRRKLSFAEGSYFPEPKEASQQQATALETQNATVLETQNAPAHPPTHKKKKREKGKTTKRK